jgi:transposase/DNA-binding XRE family transcriptional regulator
MRYELTDYEWAAIRPMLPNKPRGIPRVNDRRALNGIFWVLGSGAPWRDLPDIFGPSTTCYNRFVRWRRAGVWGKIMNALAGAHDAADPAARLLSRLKSGSMLLADRGYDGDWIRALASERGAWANIPPRCNRNKPICFSPHLYRERNLVERFFNKINSVGGSRRAATNSRQTTLPPFSSPQYDCGSALMTPRPSTGTKVQETTLSHQESRGSLKGGDHADNPVALRRSARCRYRINADSRYLRHKTRTRNQNSLLELEPSRWGRLFISGSGVLVRQGRRRAYLNVPAHELLEMARAALNWTVRDLAEGTHLHRNTITNIETGRYAGDVATLAVIAGVLKRAGVEFIDENGGGPGVRLRKRQHKKG